jgi:hypothetical protein
LRTRRSSNDSPKKRVHCDRDVALFTSSISRGLAALGHDVQLYSIGGARLPGCLRFDTLAVSLTSVPGKTPQSGLLKAALLHRSLAR